MVLLRESLVVSMSCTTVLANALFSDYHVVVVLFNLSTKILFLVVGLIVLLDGPAVGDSSCSEHVGNWLTFKVVVTTDFGRHGFLGNLSITPVPDPLLILNTL